jgi:NAD(P)-dependent dehydrogenase (short-subunit alcohol dehydrogenase family)
MSILDKLFNLKDKVAVITGGAGLLGSEYAKTLAAAGANIVIVDLDQAKGDRLAKTLEKDYQIKAIGVKADISSEQDVGLMAERVETEFGRVDILINNAAFNCPADAAASCFMGFEDYPLALWEKSLGVNLTGTFLCAQKMIKLMVKKKIKGSIINISSTYGVVAPDQRIYSGIKSKDDKSKRFIKPVDYSTTKSAILNFTRYLAALYGDRGIRVNTLTPSGVFDNQEENFVKEFCKRAPLGRMADKEDYNGAILFLASDASSYMTGANLIIDGGWTSW